MAASSNQLPIIFETDAILALAKYQTSFHSIFSDIRNLVQKQRPLNRLDLILPKLAQIKKAPTISQEGY